VVLPVAGETLFVFTSDAILLSYNPKASCTSSVVKPSATAPTWVAPASATNAPAFEAILSSNQNIGDAVHTKVQFNTKIYDTNTAYDNSTDYDFTVPAGEGGKYFVYAGAIITSTNVGNNNEGTQLTIQKDGANAALASDNLNGHGHQSTQTITVVLDLSAGEVLTVTAYMNSSLGATINIGGDTYPRSYFGAFKLVGV